MRGCDSDLPPLELFFFQSKTKGNAKAKIKGKPMKLIVLPVLFFTIFSINAKAEWLNPADIRSDIKPVDVSQSNISENEFRNIIKNIQTIYSPVIAKFGGKLSISGDWKSETPNAGASQIFGS
jgi:hypothetical protein